MVQRNGRAVWLWSVMKRNHYLRRGLALAGFEGGWLGVPLTVSEPSKH